MRQVDVIVVYKVDRLTLNVLLSFAQFEREVTGERIRDKIAASKKKGIWMGGPVPLGYDVENRKLVVNDSEASLVRHIMQRYLQLASVNALADELNAQGYRTKLQRRTSGPHRGGCSFRRGTLYHLLSNRIYIGDIIHKGEHFPGEHPPIVPAALWEAVQDKLKASASGTSRRIRAQQPSLLTGRIFDGEGRVMTPSHANKAGRRYRYYVTRPDQLAGSAAWRVPAHDLERLVCDRIAALLNDPQAVHGLVPDASAETLSRLLAEAERQHILLTTGSAHDRIQLLSATVDRITLHEDHIDLAIDPASLATLLSPMAEHPPASGPLVLELPVTKVRRGHQLRLVIPGPSKAPSVRRDEKLVMLIAETHAARTLLSSNPGRSIAAIAASAGKCRTRQPASLTARDLLNADLPLGWDQQRQLLGFA